jgi:hypothetical protein
MSAVVSALPRNAAGIQVVDRDAVCFYLMA